jgi:hypothetical protein
MREEGSEVNIAKWVILAALVIDVSMTVVYRWGLRQKAASLVAEAERLRLELETEASTGALISAAQKGKIAQLEAQIRILKEAPLKIRMVMVQNTFIITSGEASSMDKPAFDRMVEMRVERSLRELVERCRKELLVQWTDPVVQTEELHDGATLVRVFFGAMPSFGVPNQVIEIQGVRILPIVEEDGQEVEVISTLQLRRD